MNTKLVATVSTIACILFAAVAPAQAASTKAEAASTKTKAAAPQVLTEEQEVAQRAQDYKDGKIECKKRSRSSDPADVGTVMWMWANHCDYVK